MRVAVAIFALGMIVAAVWVLIARELTGSETIRAAAIGIVGMLMLFAAVWSMWRDRDELLA